MRRDKVYGAFILAAGIIGVVAYGWFLYSAPLITLQIVSFIVVAVVLGIVGWIGYMMLTTPSPKLPKKKLPESSEGGRR